MKKILILLVFLIIGITTIYAQRIVKTELYEIVYSEVYEQPISAKYSYPNPFELKYLDTLSFIRHHKAVPVKFTFNTTISPPLLKSDNLGYYVDRNGRVTNKKIYAADTDNQKISFPKVKTTKIDTVITKKVSKNWKTPIGIHTSNKDDYSLPYHRGHLVPNASFKDSAYEDVLMSYVNCAIMHQSLNKGLWLVLENKERKISKEALLNVKVILSYTPKIKVSDGGATIPTYFTKILEYRKFDENEKEVTCREVYCFPNTLIKKEKNINDYLIKELSFKN
jgi:hypothetical protein